MTRYGKLAAAMGFAIAIGVATAAKAETTVIKMKYDDDSGDLYFKPAKVTISPGDTVVWLQDDPDNEHNVAAYPGMIPEGTEPFESQMMKRVGESWAMTFTQVGSYFYHCHPHEAAGMKGLIVVGRESLPEEFRKPKAGDMSHDHGDGGHGDPEEMDHGDGHMEDMDHGDDHHGKNEDDHHADGHHGHDG